MEFRNEIFISQQGETNCSKPLLIFCHLSSSKSLAIPGHRLERRILKTSNVLHSKIKLTTICSPKIWEPRPLDSGCRGDHHLISTHNVPHNVPLRVPQP